MTAPANRIGPARRDDARRRHWAPLAAIGLALLLAGCGSQIGTNYFDASGLTCRQIVERHAAKVRQATAYAREVEARRGTRTIPHSTWDYAREVPDFTPEEQERYYDYFADMSGMIDAFEREGCGPGPEMYKLHDVRR